MRGRNLKSVNIGKEALKHKGVKQVARKTRTISSQLHVPEALPLGKRATMPAEQGAGCALRPI